MMKFVQSLVGAALAVLLPLACSHAAPLESVPAAPSSYAAQATVLGATWANGRLVAVGDHGIVLLSDDRGRSFRQAPSVPLSSPLTGVSFVDAKHGWAVGHWGAILVSSDGGEMRRYAWTPRYDYNLDEDSGNDTYNAAQPTLVISGGETLVHHHELTYCLALPAGPPWQDRRSWTERMHALIMTALATLGVSAQTTLQEEAVKSDLCFQHPTPGDVMVGRAKIVGSAQRKRRGALLQHGAVLLASSPWAPRARRSPTSRAR